MERWSKQVLGPAIILSLLLQSLAPFVLAAAPSPSSAPYTALFPGWYTAQATSLSVTKSDAPDPVDQGALITYIITVTNQTAEEAHQVVVTDTTPAGTVFESASVLDGGGATWFWGGLSAGESGEFVWFTSDRVFPDASGLPGNASAVLQFVVRVVGPFPDQGLVHNDAYYADAANAARVQGPDVTTTVNAPAFALGKVAATDPISAGARLTYTVRLTNTGHLTTSRPYTVVETLPPLVTYAGSNPPAQVAGGVLTWTLSIPLGPGEAAAVTFAVTVTAPLTDGLPLVNADYLAFSGEVAAPAYGPPLTTTVRSWPLLVVGKTDEPDPVLAGGTIRYALVVTNDTAANGPAQGLVVTDRVPLNTTLLEAPGAAYSGTGPGSVITWTWPSYLWPGQAVTVAFTVTVDSTVVSGTLVTNGDYGATAVNALAPSLGPAVTTTVQSFPDLRLVKTAAPAVLSPDGWVTFTLVFTNAGTSTATGVQVTDTLPISLTQVSWTGTANVSLQAAAHPHYTWTVTPLLPGEGGVITLTAQVLTTTAWGQSTVLTNLARISTADIDIQPGDNDDWATITVVPGPAAQVLLSVSPSNPTVDCTAAVTATVLDAWGNPVADGTVVTFTTDLGAVDPPTDTTVLGTAFTTLSAMSAGPVVVTGTAPTDAAGAVVVSFEPGAPTSFVFAPVSDQTAGVGFTLVLTALDQHGNVATGFAGTVALADETGTLAPTVGGPAVAGVVTQTVAITRAWVGDRITATAWVTPVCGAPHWATGTSDPFTVTHAAPVAASLAPPRATVPAGTSLPYTTVATDTYGNAWDATLEAAYAASGGNAFPGTPPGNHVLSATVVGVDLPVTATVGGVQAVAYVTVTHGTAVQLVISPPATTVVAGTWVTYTAVATDAFGNGWDATAETAFAAGGGNVFVGSVLSATVAGTWSVTGTLGSARDTGTVTVTPGEVHHLAFAPIGTQTVGVGFGVLITAEDRFGNAVPGFAGTLALADTTGSLTPTSWSSWSGGTASFTAVITRAWRGDRITATTVATPSIWGVSDPFDVLAGAPSALTYQTPATMPVCSRAPVTATVVDQWGNPVEDGTVVTLVGYGGLTFLENGSYTYDPTTVGGQATATLVAPDFAVLAATSAQAGSVGPVFRSVQVVTPGLPSALDLVATPSVIQAVTGTAVLTATVRDCAGNPIPGVVVAFSASLGSVTALTATTGPDGQVTAYFSSTVAGTGVITATADGLSRETTVTVLPAVTHVFLPLVLKDFRGINLIVESIEVSPPSPSPGESVLVSVTIRNVGPTPVQTAFWVDLYLDPVGTPAPGVRWDQICDEGVAWLVPGLGGGESLTLRSDQGAPNYTYWTGKFSAQPDPHLLYAVVDVWPGPPGAVEEDNEDDNIRGPRQVPMGP